MDSARDVEAQPENREPLQRDVEGNDTGASETAAPPGGLGSGFSSSPIDGDPHRDEPSEDFDDRAAEFWSVYVKEARSHDEALIGTWKDDMEGVIIFAGLYSASLTAFIVESYKTLRPDPVQENAYYARQSVVLLAQISAQLAASGSPVPSTVPVPPAFPDFHAAQSDVRINIFWFMSLVFSLSAALAATLVQQWVREYVHVFQRYSHPLKCARIRQFLREGADSWHMDLVVNLVPALIHISLFLFFLGLAEFLFKINTATATTTTIVIVICALGYLFSIVAPVLDAQSPYQSPLSGLFWLFIFGTISRRTYKDHSPSGQQERISTNMTEGRVQLAMVHSGDRKDRDAQAIKWIVDDLTEDSELEPLVRNIPDSFNSKWGKTVWEIVAENESKSSGTLYRLNTRMARLLRTCTDPGAFPGQSERERRTRACIGASLSLVLSVKYEWQWLTKSGTPTMAQVLVYLGGIRKIRDAQIPNPQLGEALTTKLDSTSGVRWTCMSMIVVCKMFQTSDVRDAAKRVINSLAEVRGEREGSEEDKAAKAAETARTIDEYLRTSWVSANTLHRELTRDVESDNIEDRLRKIVQERKDKITTLDDTWNVFGWVEETDKAIVRLVQTLREATSGVLDYLPDAVFSWQEDPRSLPEKGTDTIPSHLMPQFIPPRLLVQRLWLCASALRRISKTGWGASRYAPKRLADLSAPELSMPKIRKLMDDTRAPMMQTQLWRLQDLRDGGHVYTLELFIESIKSSSKAVSDDSSRELYEATFLYITCKWKENRHEIWTERLLVDLLRRVLPANNDPPSDQVPEYMIDCFLTFLADVLKGKEGVQNATSQIKTYSEGLSDPRGVVRDALSKLESRGTAVL